MNNGSGRPWNSGIVSAIIWTTWLALITGVALIPFFKADPKFAYSSVTDMSHSAGLTFLRDIHHWSSALIIILGVTYVVTGLYRGVYEKPGHKVWIMTILLFVLGMLMQLTGHLLPMDQHAVRTTVIETGIATNAPVIGEMQAKLLRAGDLVGPNTFYLWLKAHIAFLAVVTLALSILVPLAGRKEGVSFKRVPWILGAFGLVVLAALTLHAPLGKPAAADDFNGLATRPEWYVLPLHSLLDIAQSLNRQMAFLGTMVLPGLALLFILALPWLDRRARLGKALGVVGGLALIGLFLMTVGNVAPPVGDQIVVETGGGQVGNVKLDPKLVAQGKTLFADQGCVGCHTIAGKGGKAGPNLTNEASRHADIDWQIRHLKDPAKVTPGSTMPDYADLKASELQALAQYLVSLKE